MDFAALVISIVSAAATVAAAVVAGISIRISRRATTAAEASAAEARRSADAAEGTHRIELERHYEQARPGLEGRVTPRPAPSVSTSSGAPPSSGPAQGSITSSRCTNLTK